MSKEAQVGTFNVPLLLLWNIGEIHGPLMGNYAKLVVLGVEADRLGAFGKLDLGQARVRIEILVDQAHPGHGLLRILLFRVICSLIILSESIRGRLKALSDGAGKLEQVHRLVCGRSDGKEVLLRVENELANSSSIITTLKLLHALT